MGVTIRNFGVLIVVAILTGVASSAGSAAGRHRAHRVRTYKTRGTLPLRTALDDPFTLTGPERAIGFVKARAAGASYVRIVASWNDIAPTTPPVGFAAADPTSLGYSWSWLDGTLASAEAAGLTPMLDIARPPAWAQVPSGRGGAAAPKIAALEQFATALAVHYDGKHAAPSVHVFQVWNEPNLSFDLSPVKAAVYREMVNAVAASVHAVSGKNLVVAGGLDPFGNKAKHWYSVAPLAFMRSLLCVSMGNRRAKKKRLRRPHASCKRRIHFDVWSHHPYTFNGPFGHARGKDDVSLGDLPRMRKVLREAVKLHHVVSPHRVQFWVTEFSWDTKPPRRHAAPIRLAARWTAEAVYQMWRSGVSLVTWFGLEDKGGKTPYKSGLFFHAKSLEHARAKPVRTAFRFPFVAYLGRRTVTVWGRDATSDRRLVTIERRRGRYGRWRVVARIRSNRSGIFQAKIGIAATKRDWLRAVARRSGKSLAFSLTRPSPKLRYGPWGN